MADDKNEFNIHRRKYSEGSIWNEGGYPLYQVSLFHLFSRKDFHTRLNSLRLFFSCSILPDRR